MGKKYKLLKDYESPTMRIHAGTINTEIEWMRKFPFMDKGDCEIKKDWFKEMSDEEIHQIKYTKWDMMNFGNYCILELTKTKPSMLQKSLIEACFEFYEYKK